MLAALLLLGGWAGFQLAGEMGQQGTESSDSRLTADRNAATPNGSRAAARLPSANVSASAGAVSLSNSQHNPLMQVVTGKMTLTALPVDRPSVRFNGHRFGFDPDAPMALAECQRRLGEGSNVVALLGLTVQPGPQIRTELTARGVDLLDYVPNNGWIARVRGNREPSLDARLFLFRHLDASLRIQAAFREPAVSRSDVAVYVHPASDRPVTGILGTLVNAGFSGLTTVAVGDRTHLAGTIAAHRLPEFLRLASTQPDTLWIEPGRGARVLNAKAGRTTQSGAYDGTTPFFERGIFGNNQVIAICDTGLDVDSCFFRDAAGRLPPANRLGGLNVDWSMRKVIAADFLDPDDHPEDPLAWDNHGHGTAVACTAAGASLYDPWNPQADNGMAPGARLIIQDAGFRDLEACAELPGLGCPVTNFYPALLQAVAQGATIHNNSWGDLEGAPEPNIYSQTCRELDLVTWSNKQFLVVCAAGNSYLSDTVGSPSTAKNGVSVAAALSGISEGRVAGFSSRGWASDGRFKPDLTAPGHNLRTAASDGDLTTENCYRANRSGTSFAAPVVAGLAALVRDYFAQGFYPTGNPVTANQWPGVSAAVVKAVLINASAPMSLATAPPPSRDQGWGRVNLSQTLRLSSDEPALLAIDQSPGFAQSPVFPYRTYLRLTGTNLPLKVTLVWSDYPAAPGADLHLVNDLDLRVRTPRLAMKGNRLLNGQSVPGGDYDRLNNVEQVEWTPDQAEIVELSVWAHRIVVGPQDFALIASGDFEAIAPSLDEDADGLPDFWELWHVGNLDPLPQDDPDGDGATNAAEFAANTDPTNADSVARLELARREPMGMTLRMKVSEGRQYVLESSVGSPLGPWFTVSEPALMGDPMGEATMVLTNHLPAHHTGLGPQFYRVRIDASH